MEYLRVQFQATMDEVREATQIYVRRNVPGLAVAFGLFLLIGSFLGFGASTPLIVRIPLSLVVGIGGGLLWEKLIAGRITGLFEAKRDEGKTVDCTFELRPEGLWVRQDGLEETHSWSQVSDIEDMNGDVRFRLDLGLAIIRKRAFPSQDYRSLFVNTMKDFAANSRAGTA